ARTGLHLRQLPLYPGLLPRAMTFSPDGRRLAFLLARNNDFNSLEVRIWDLALNRMVLELPKPPGGALSMAFSPDGRRIAVGGSEGLRLFDAQTGEQLLDFMRARLPVHGLSFSPDGQRLATVSAEVG